MANGKPGGIGSDTVASTAPSPPTPPPGGGGTGQSVNSISGEYTLDPRLIAQPRMKMRREVYPGATTSEVATVVVNDLVFEDWESVWIQWKLGEPYQQFKFVCAEADPEVGKNVLRFHPGDFVKIYLGGWPVIWGVILQRQVAYDAKQHGVTFQGVSITWYAARASIMDKTEFEGSFLDIAKEVLAPTCSGHKVWGDIDSTPFKPPAKASDGETIWNFLERIGREKYVMVASDPYGDFVFIGSHTGKVAGDLIEGVNILKCQCIRSTTRPYSHYSVIAQKPATDQDNMKKAAHMKAELGGTAKCYSPNKTPIEHPVWTQHEVDLRVQAEHGWNEYDIIEAYITVQGWFNPLTGLRWDVGQAVKVVSPMATLDDVLKIEAVTYTQDNRSGSLTEMKLVHPRLWRDNVFSVAGRPGFMPGGTRPPPERTRPAPTPTPTPTPPAPPANRR